MRQSDLKWEIRGKLTAKGEKLKVEEIVDILLKNRGLTIKKQREEFFNPPHPDKLSLNDLKIDRKSLIQAVHRISKAITNNEKIIIYGDYDADGICATAIAWETLNFLGGKVLPYIPDRFSEGYGINPVTIEKLKENDPNLSLIITVDNGIVADKAIDRANNLGIDVIITDHHLKGKRIPKADSILHTTQIGGAGLSWILSRELKRKFQISNSKFQMGDGLELSAIGTIADQLSLIGANRSFAKHGLEVLNKTKRPGLLALFEEAGLIGSQDRFHKASARQIGTYEVNFLIAPRINAMGRLEHAIDSLRLLCTTNKRRAYELAQVLGRTNQQRQKVLENSILHAKKQASQSKQTGVILISHESYHEGVIGLAASKLVEEFYRPAIVISRGQKYSKASARSISGFNIIESIMKLEDLILSGGGHPMAAGFTIETEKIEIFSKKLEEISAPLLSNEVLTKRLIVDSELKFDLINQNLADKLQEFDPTGTGNPKPTFVTYDVNPIDAKLVGTEGNHLKLKLEKDNVQLPAIGFGLGEMINKLSPDKKISLVYNIENNVWNGEKIIQIKIKDIKVD